MTVVEVNHWALALLLPSFLVAVALETNDQAKVLFWIDLLLALTTTLYRWWF